MTLLCIPFVFVCMRVCVCVSISGNEFLAKQNWSPDLVFMQLASLPRSSTNEGESLHHTTGVQVKRLPHFINLFVSVL